MTDLEMTFVDGLFDHLQECGYNADAIREMVRDEDYDSEALVDDSEQIGNSNTEKELGGSVLQRLREYTLDYQRMKCIHLCFSLWH